MLAAYPTTSLPIGPDPTPLVILFIAGFLVMMFGRLISSGVVTAAGITMIFVTTIIVPIVYFLF